jgi:hypothetical protein
MLFLENGDLHRFTAEAILDSTVRFMKRKHLFPRTARALRQKSVTRPSVRQSRSNENRARTLRQQQAFSRACEGVDCRTARFVIGQVLRSFAAIRMLTR